MVVADNKLDTKAARLIYIRETLGHKPSVMAQMLQMNQSNYQGLEDGKRAIGPNITSRICATFRVSRSWLETGEGEVFTHESDQDQTAVPVRLADADKIRLETENKMLREQVDLLTKLLANKRID